ncbi:hypothetical protein OS493_039049 [Desmophyllum pertusum]|uniref:NADP-dependent oxidoreductase domain-containing protein n=1 Tax=Desmophyllum pertusum TaxID=174260 RepID=A0A9W9YHG2_9CNID|nr:hypothetical protein OS493_039049 [Desmophyllum pertusum]
MSVTAMMSVLQAFNTSLNNLEENVGFVQMPWMKLKEQGLIRSIGVSNFGVNHLKEMEKAGLPTPAVNQIELNAYWRLEDIVKYCQEKGIAVMGYAPIFRGQKK